VGLSIIWDPSAPFIFIQVYSMDNNIHYESQAQNNFLDEK